MSMKKKLLSLLIPMFLIGLTGCVKYNGQPKDSSREKIIPSSAEPISYSIEPSIPPAPHGGGESEPVVPPETSVKVYLVFGENGLFEGNPVSDKVESKFLEHTKEITANVGSDLPGKDKVTSSVKGSTFVAWTAYNNDGKLTEYTKVPAVDGKILYASFTGGEGGSHSGGGSSGGETPQPSDYPVSTVGDLPTAGFGLKFYDGSFMAGVSAPEYEGYLQYSISKRSFKQGQSFALCDFGNGGVMFMAYKVNDYSFGGNPDNIKYTEYLSVDTANKKYVVLKDFKAESIYLKFKTDLDEIYIELAK